MTILVVSPYPPVRDGIGAYAVQEVLGLRAEGFDVQVVSPEPSAAPHHNPLGSVQGWIRLQNRFGDFERTVIQVYPELMVGACRNWAERAAAWSAAAAFTRGRPTELRIHEIDYSALRQHRAERNAARRFIESAERVTVHTERERDQLTEELGVDRSAVELIDHGAHFVRRVGLTRPEARQELGLDLDAHIFVSVGFIQAHKGFDRAVAAFERLGAADRAELHIAGSVRVDNAELLNYAERLGARVASVPGAALHVRYLSDWEFDLWLVASDTVLLPYREIWSSSVVERAKLYSRFVIASDVGGLANQLGDGVAVSTDDELADAMAARVGVTHLVEPSAPAPAELQTLISRQTAATTPSGTPIVGPGAQVMARLGGGMPPVAPASGRRGVGRIKSLVQRATAWQISPVLDRLNEVQLAATEAVAKMEQAESDPPE